MEQQGTHGRHHGWPRSLAVWVLLSHGQLLRPCHKTNTILGSGEVAETNEIYVLMELNFCVKTQILNNMYSMSHPVKSIKEKYTGVKMDREPVRRGDETVMSSRVELWVVSRKSGQSGTWSSIGRIP